MHSHLRTPGGLNLMAADVPEGESRTAGTNITLSLSGDVKVQTETFFDPDNIVHQDGYTTWNAAIALDSRDERWRLALWGRNLGDDDHCANIISLSESTVALCSLDALRSYGVNLLYRLR